jgi:GMP synthase-like glutamine amidotransferase
MGNQFRIAIMDAVQRIYWKDDDGFTDSAKFADLLAPLNPDAKIDCFYATENEFPDSVDDYDAFLITGSPASANDNLRWVHQLSDLIVRADSKNKRIIGSCFGHQLVAKTFGGSVALNEQGWMIGNYKLDITRQYDWMQPQADSTGLFHFNQERVTQLPEAAISFANSEAYPDFAFTLGDNIMCLQGHPEQPLRAMNNFLKAMSTIPESEIKLAREQISRGEPDSKVWGQWMMRFFEA